MNRQTMSLRQVMLMLLLSFFSVAAIAQTQKITGTVVDSKGTPLEGVTVKVQTTNALTTSNKAGAFTINAKTDDLIEFSFVGFESKKVKATNGSLNVVLNAATTDLQDVILVGSRGTGRAKLESPVPVDVIKISEVAINTARMDLTSSLNYAAPSFNYNKQSGADGADHVDIGTLRGLGPDQTLVLINGKRRHSTALVGLFGTRGRGNSGVDLNGFSQASVDRIEILRDGASAQYGSDAIAGVMNVILKKNTNEWNIITGLAGYYDKKFNTNQFKDNKDYLYGNPIDGVTSAIQANRGFDLGKKGASYLDDPTKVDHFLNSPYTAINVAYKMGAKTIGLIGVDFTDGHFYSPKDGQHSLARMGYLKDLNGGYSLITRELENRGVSLFNLSKNSRIDTVKKITLEEFKEL